MRLLTVVVLFVLLTVKVPLMVTFVFITTGPLKLLLPVNVLLPAVVANQVVSFVNTIWFVVMPDKFVSVADGGWYFKLLVAAKAAAVPAPLVSNQVVLLVNTIWFVVMPDKFVSVAGTFVMLTQAMLVRFVNPPPLP